MLLMKEVKPFAFFNYISLLFIALGLFFAAPVLAEYFKTGLVERIPTWIMSMSLFIMAVLSFMCGIILDSVARGRLEKKTLVALSIQRLEPPKD